MRSGLFKNLSALNEHHEVNLKAIGHAVLLADKFTSSLLKILKSDDFESHFYTSPVSICLQISLHLLY